jgi:hypothetical protein
MNKVLMVNLAFWATAIAFPIVIRLLPTSTGETPKFFEFFVPLFQIMLACGATYLVKTAIEKKPSN